MCKKLNTFKHIIIIPEFLHSGFLSVASLQLTNNPTVNDRPVADASAGRLCGDLDNPTSYWQDWQSTDPRSGSWNWTADANQLGMAKMARARGSIVELFSNSPVRQRQNKRRKGGHA